MVRPKARDGEKRGGDGVLERHAGRQHEPGDDEKAAADAEEAGKEPDPRADEDQARQEVARALLREADVVTGRFRLDGDHVNADADHQEAKQREQLRAAKLLAEVRTGESAGDTGRGEHHGAGPFHGSEPCMGCEPCAGVERDRDSRRSDGDMGRRHAHRIDQERDSEDGASAADEAERDTDKGAGAQEERDGDEAKGHGLQAPAARLFQGMISSSLAMPHQPDTPPNTSPAPINPASR